MLSQGGTLTIVFSDIEQSTRRGEELGDEALDGAVGFHNSLVRRHVERAGGVEVKAQGDGFMFAFPSARPRCCVRSRSCARSRLTAGPRPTDALRVRIGMHTGEAIVEDGDLFGQPVVLAARIANQARGGEILVSSLVREIVESRGDLTFGQTRAVRARRVRGRAHSAAPGRLDGRDD